MSLFFLGGEKRGCIKVVMKEFDIAFEFRHVPSDEELKRAAAKALGVSQTSLGGYDIVRKSLDARSQSVLYRYRIVAWTDSDKMEPEYSIPPYRDVTNAEPVIIIGAGPAGLFAALRLLQEGVKPVILERGKDIHNRKRDIAALSRDMIINPDSNYCFGEGGAGTFSDGKLFTRSSKKGDIREILYQLVQFGADESILIDAHPHIGSDKLPAIMERIRLKIVECGGEYHFDSRVTDIVREGSGWRVDTLSGQFSAGSVILATGHSAEDIYRLFHSKGWALEAKGFALGVRTEHPQYLINDIQYHGKSHPLLPAAEYSLVTQVEGRGVFSFCMCPGGLLVPSVTSSGELVLNGMSNSNRSSKWANAGVVVSVEPEDVPEYDRYGVMSLLEFRKSVESDMYRFSNSIKAPSQRMTDFVRKKESANLPKSSYFPGTLSAPLNELLPDFVASRLKEAFPFFDRKMRGYYTSEALLLGVESRTSSPVRIPRDPITREHISLPGLYPCGEGAGYSGGIVSSAMDGINSAAVISVKNV